MQIQLKPCPFCKGKEIAINPLMPPFRAHCKGCGATGPSSNDSKDMAALYWNAASLEWTTTRPRKPGFYFYKSSKGRIWVTHIERLELVHRHGITGIMMVDGDVEQELDRLPGQWAGPIPEPAQ